MSEQAIQEALTEALHPEFGYEWREPDGVIFKATQSAREEILAPLRAAFRECFTPDMAGVDWKDDAAIQTFARKIIRIIGPGPDVTPGAAASSGTGDEDRPSQGIALLDAYRGGRVKGVARALSEALGQSRTGLSDDQTVTVVDLLVGAIDTAIHDHGTAEHLRGDLERQRRVAGLLGLDGLLDEGVI